VRGRAFVGGWVGIAAAVACLSASNDVAAAAATPLVAARGAAVPQERALRIVCSHSCFIRNPYEVDYSGTETLSTLHPVPSQPFSQAGRKLYIKLKWDLRVFRSKDTNDVIKRSAIVSGVVDLTIPDSPTADCTAQYSLSAADAKDQLDTPT
jgi:hypothetical protein